MGIYMTTVQWRDVLEILIIAFLLYYILAWMKNTRAWSLLKGIIVIALFLVVASIMQLDTIIWIAKNVVNYAIIALLLVLQPELRKGLENLGRKNILGDILSTTGINSTDVESISAESISEIVKACTEMGKARTGALIVIQRAEFLSEYETTGIAVDGKITSGLLINIFEKNTPLHDGAVIIVGNRVTAATCYLPLSDNMGLSKDLGTRHRAAVGVSEKTDAVTIIVSEETGRISLAIDGKIEPISDGEQLKTRLTKLVSKAREKRRKTRRRRSDENNTEVKTGEGAADEKV
ncbi:MAG: diadenylate cyclase CdaA [Lachnospiraceae bacterium]|nr:diadenylate cyclase CdaA [Lachnospiraceae bacterium]MBR6302307.1 diadenylate cyclase CdaA [Lachnospiraceae bacterium]